MSKISVPEVYATTGQKKENTEQSLAMILQEQFIEKEMESVLAATEIREHEVMGWADGLMSQFVNQIVGTRKEHLKGARSEKEKLYVQYRLTLKEAILEDPNNMVWLVQNTYWRFLGILRQSLNRASRKEGVVVASSGVQRSLRGEDLSFKDRILAKLGRGNYRLEYREKDQI